MVTEELEEDYPVEHVSEQDAVVEIVEEGGSRFTRKRLVTTAALTAGGALGAALVVPAVSLGPILETGKFYDTPWRRGRRLVDDGGRPWLASDIEEKNFYTAFPEGADREQLGAPVVVVRLKPGGARPSGRTGELGAGRDPRLLEDLHARRLRHQPLPDAALPAGRAEARPRLPVPLLDLRPGTGSGGHLRARRPSAAPAAAVHRRWGQPARRRQLLGAGRALLVGRPKR